MNPKVDEYLNKAHKWREELRKLRAILLQCGLTEELKWGKPCYMFQQSNVAILQAFKESCALLLTKGALLSDPHGLLEKPGENTQAARRFRFTSVGEIAGMERILKDYLHESMSAEKAGLKVDFKKQPEPIPEELETKFTELPVLRAAFAALTPGRQRAYVLYFSAAKQPKTRTSRIDQCVPQILEGKGLTDDYKKGAGRQ